MVQLGINETDHHEDLHEEFGRFWIDWTNFGVFLTAVPIIVVNLIGNTFTVVAFAIDAKLRECNQNVYIINLAVTDFVVGLIVMPLYVYYTERKWRWGLDLAGCKFLLAIDLWLKAEASLTLILISHDRMLMIRDGENYDVGEKRKKAYRNITFTWFISFIVYCPTIVFFEKFLGRSVLEEERCTIEFETEHFNWFSVLLSGFEFLYPVICLTLFCTMLMVSLYERSKALKQVSNELVACNILLQKEKELAWCLCLMVIVYAICWTPLALSFVIRAICGHCIDPVVLEFFLWLLWLNSAINPFHYAHSNPRFYSHFKRMLCPYFFPKVAPMSSVPTLTLMEMQRSFHLSHRTDESEFSEISQFQEVEMINVHHVHPDSTATESRSIMTNMSRTPGPRTPIPAINTEQLHMDINQQILASISKATHYKPSHHIVDIIGFEHADHMHTSRHAFTPSMQEVPRDP